MCELIKGQSHDEITLFDEAIKISPPDMRALLYMNSAFRAIDHKIPYK